MPSQPPASSAASSSSSDPMETETARSESLTKAIVRRKPFQEKWNSVSTDPEPLANLLATWKGVIARLRQYAERQVAEKNYSTAADNANMAEIMECCASDLEKSLSLYTIEEVEGSPAKEPRRRTRKVTSPASAADSSMSPPESRPDSI